MRHDTVASQLYPSFDDDVCCTPFFARIQSTCPSIILIESVGAGSQLHAQAVPAGATPSIPWLLRARTLCTDTVCHRTSGSPIHSSRSNFSILSFPSALRLSDYLNFFMRGDAMPPRRACDVCYKRKVINHMFHRPSDTGRDCSNNADLLDSMYNQYSGRSLRLVREPGRGLYL